MTDDEKRQQKAALLLEYQETEDEERHLYERAHRISDGLNQLLRVIQADLGALIDDRHAHYDQQVVILKANMREAMNLDAMLDLADEIRKTKFKLADLKRRKEALGVCAPETGTRIQLSRLPPQSNFHRLRGV